ncbi:hypothetical protein [[Pantoea] beijingensis]|nr:MULTISPECIES: hypothetical protein [Erwiniaceae]
MLTLLIIAVLIALMAFAVIRHVQARNSKTINHPHRHLRRR